MKKILIVLLIIAFATSITVMGIGCKEGAAEEVAEETTEAAPEEAAAEEEVKVVAEEDMTFTLVCQWQPNALLNRIIFGMDQAASDLGVTANFVAPQSNDVPGEVDLLNSVIADGPDGISILITENAAFQESIDLMNSEGIPWGTYNTGDWGLGEKQLFYIGALHYDSGVAIAEYVLENWPLGDKPTRFLIVNPLPGHSALDARAEGITDVMTAAGIPGDMIDSTNEQAESITRTSAYLIDNPDTDVVFPIGLFQNYTTDLAIDELGLTPGVDIINAPHDFDDFTAGAIESGRIMAVSDQQMFMQGYLSVTYLYLNAMFGMQPPHTNSTGPAIIDASNIDSYKSIMEQTDAKYGES